jgi:hypothetical protein
VKIQPQWVVTPTNEKTNKHLYKTEKSLNKNKKLKGRPISFWRTNTTKDISILLQKAKNLATE